MFDWEFSIYKKQHQEMLTSAKGQSGLINQPFHSNNLWKTFRPQRYINLFILSGSIWRFNRSNQTSVSSAAQGPAAYLWGHGFSRMPCKGVMRLNTSIIIEWVEFLNGPRVLLTSSCLKTLAAWVSSSVGDGLARTERRRIQKEEKTDQ